ncbi:NHS-like protein 2 [Callorhinchus milii]|uniref:NHS-like protein 2 n=1 Tax=Callorhinchus milii TaxID=7868 RepID=UPI001C3F5151|nr:NHS-like protein 2 [Callorhinchus milii]
MEFHTGTLTISRHKRAGSNLDQESKRTAHFRSSWQQNVNVFSSSSRPPCVEELHQEAQLNLQSLLQEEYGELTRDSQAASNTFGQKSSLSSRESTPESGRQGERRLEFVLMPTASRFIEDETSCIGIRARETSPQSPTASDPQPGWSQAVSLSAAGSVQAHVVPINVTGESLERHANTRHSLFNTDTAINPKSTLRRRRTVSSLLEAANPQRGVCAEGPVSPRGLGSAEPPQRLFTFDDEPRVPNGRRDSASSSGLRKVLSDLGQLSHPSLSPSSENIPLPANHTQTMRTSHSVHAFPSLSNSWDATRGAGFSHPWTGLGVVCPPSPLGSAQAHRPSLPSDLSGQAQPIPSHLSCPSLHAKPGGCLDNHSSSGPLQCASRSSPEPGPAMSTFLPIEGQVVTPLFPTRPQNIKNIRTNHERIIVCTNERGEEKLPTADARSFRERSLSTPTDSGSSCSGEGVPGPGEQHRRNSESYVMRYPSASSEDSQGPEPQGPSHARPRSRSISLKKPKRKPPPPVRGVSLKPGGTGLKLQIFEPQVSRGEKRPTRLFLANEKRGIQSESMDSNESSGFTSIPRSSGPNPRDGEFSDNWFLNDWKSNDPYRSLSNSSTATGTTVIECLKPRSSCESLSSPSLSRATTPSQLSVETESKLSSPGRVPGLMSPSSGYSSQSETPTAAFPISVFHGGPSPHQAGKIKPKVPERKSSLQPPSPNEKSPRSKQMFELPVVVPHVSALKPPTKAKPKTGRRHSETASCNGGKPAPSPSQPTLPVITQTVLESVRLRSISRSENEDNNGEAFPEPPTQAHAAPGHRKVGPPVAGKPPMSKRPSSIVLKVSPCDLTSPLVSPPGTCPAPSPTWLFRKTRKEEGMDGPLCPRPPAAVSPGYRASERAGPSQTKLSAHAPELPAEAIRGRGEATGRSAQPGERSRKKSKTPPPVPRKPTVLILPTNRQHILVVAERSEHSPLPSPTASPLQPGTAATNTASETQALPRQPDISGAHSPIHQPPSPTYQAGNATHQAPSPTHQAPSPTHQAPSPTYQAPSPTHHIYSSVHHVGSPTHKPGSFTCQDASPTRQISSPTRQNDSPKRQIGSPTHQIGSPTHQIGSPTHQISSPTRQIGSPTHQIGSPTRQIGSPTRQIGSPTRQIGSPTRQIGSPTRQIGSPTHQEEYSNQNFNDGFGVCLNTELSTDPAQVLSDAVGTRSAGQSGPGSLQSEDSITEEDEDVFVSPGVPRSTEDLFTVIHRSKRKVLGWKEPGETFRIREVAPSPTKPPSITAGAKASTSNENFKALLQRKGGKSGATGRVSATELLKTTNPLARRATDCTQEPERPRGPAESTAWS